MVILFHLTSETDKINIKKVYKKRIDKMKGLTKKGQLKIHVKRNIFDS